MSFLNNNLDGAVKTVQDIQSKYLCGICRGIIDNATRPDVCSHVYYTQLHSYLIDLKSVCLFKILSVLSVQQLSSVEHKTMSNMSQRL